mgnify:CR=1 FL=1
MTFANKKPDLCDTNEALILTKLRIYNWERNYFIVGLSMQIWGVQPLLRESLYRLVNNDVMNDRRGYVQNFSNVQKKSLKKILLAPKEYKPTENTELFL